MGRGLQKQESHIALKNHGPGCMWGILHNLQQNRWHKVVKRLPRARLTYGKHSHGQEREKASSSVEQVDQEIIEPSVRKPIVEAKRTDPSPSHKNSVKSRIRAFTEEVYKKKGRHRRSTSYPVRKPPDENLPSHQKGKSLDGVVPQNVVEGSNHSANSDSSSHHIRLNYLKQNEVDQLGDQPVRDHTLVHGNLIYAIEPSRGDALQESKLFMDALNLLNMREEMFQHILKDPSISLANQLHCRRSPNLRYGLNKSMSFAASAPLVGRDFDDLEGSTRKHETRCVKGDDQNLNNGEISKANECCEVLDNAASPAAAAANILRKKSDENRAGLVHFKNIREKIKHVIRDRKKEKTRIMMDALHHRIPYGVSPSKKVAEEGGQPVCDFGKCTIKDYKRTTSFDNSLDRYNQLLDISSSKEAKEHSCDESKSNAHSTIARKPATLGRILSLPDIRSHIPDIRFNEGKALDRVDSEGKAGTSSVSGDKNQEVKDVGVSFDDSTEAKASQTSPHPPPSKSVAEQQEHEAFISDDSRFSTRPSHIDDSCIHADLIDLDGEDGELDLYNTCVSPQGAVGIAQESQIQELYNDLIHVQGDDADAKNNAEFNYVRGVLELSGFSRGEALGKWHSEEYPLNPSVFEEVVDQHECCAGNQEDGISNQILLFDLINEVLLGIHERSFCYWPTPLTTRSSMHPLPKGSRVLEAVWAEIRWLLSSSPQSDHDMDDAVSRDLARNDGWMNLQLDAECVGLELEELIFDDLVDEIFAA